MKKTLDEINGYREPLTFDELCESQDFKHDQEFVLKEDYDNLQQVTKELVSALEFYADGESWSTIDMKKIPVTYDRLEYEDDLGDGSFQLNEQTDDYGVSGKRARQALASYKEKVGMG